MLLIPMARLTLNPRPSPPDSPPAEVRRPAVDSRVDTPARISRREQLLSPSGIVLLSLALLVLVTVACVGLALGVIKGYPDSAPKNVAIYYQASPGAAGLSAYLHPPLSSIQAPGRSQFLAFQFTNRGTAAVTLEGLRLFSANCFRIDPVSASSASAADAAGADSIRVSGEGATPATTVLNPNQAVLIRYRLSLTEGEGCAGQAALVFVYSWREGRDGPVEQQSISTGPIEITTLSELRARRFFSLAGRAIPLFLLPLLLAIGNYLLQDLQQRKAATQKEKEETRADQQRDQAQKLEVWKAIIPMMVTAIRDHYVPMVRVLVLIESEAGRGEGQADLDEILACALLYRRLTNHLVDVNGGFYFRNHHGETLCASLGNLLHARLYRLSGDHLLFRESAEKLDPKSTTNRVRRKLGIDAGNRYGPFAGLRGHFIGQLQDAARMAQLKSHAVLLRKLMEHEINDPFYPFWYETEPAPLQEAELKHLVAELHLDLEDAAEVLQELEAYLGSLRTKPDRQ